MDNFIVVVDRAEDWKPYYPTDQVILAKDYLFDNKFQITKNLKVLNLCHKIKYLSKGYYCSMLAEARRHKVLPDIQTINDLGKRNLYIQELEDLDALFQKAGQNFSFNMGISSFSFRVFFSRTQLRELSEIARRIYEYYPCPIIEVKLQKKSTWKVSGVMPVGLRDLSNEEQDFFAESLDLFSNRIWRTPKSRKKYLYDLAILVNPDEKMPPSDKGALRLFREACERNNVYSEIINRKDISRLSEFDALFIRETTNISDHTYLFSRIASSEGLVVIDDPSSILRCTNKIFLSNLLERIGVPSIPSLFISDTKIETLQKLEATLGYPMVVKIPDGSFSVGIVKVEDQKELKTTLNEYLQKSELVLVQKFFYTKFDWRVGVLENQALYACRYYMSENHWQIYNHDKEISSETFSGNADTLAIVDVPAKVLQVALKVTTAIGKGLYGVDLKEDEQGNVYVVEVNDNPSIDSGVEDKFLGDELYERIIKWFVKEINRQKDLVK